ncbi:MAG: hypothetical protein ACRDD7_09445 [Peptostreptococcaceae bacterium]
MKPKNVLNFSVGFATIGLVYWLMVRQQEIVAGILIGFLGTFALIGVIYLIHAIGQLIVAKTTGKKIDEFEDL